MAVEKSPAFQFYPKDFLSDGKVAAMTLAERGAYITLLSLCWLEGSLPDDPRRLAQMVGASGAEFRKLWPALAPCFAVKGDALIHKRLDVEREKQNEYRRRQSDKGRASAAQRATEQQPEGNRRPTEPQPKVNSPSPSSSPFKKEQIPVRVLVPMNGTLDEAVAERAGRFCERYSELYPQHRRGARYLPKPALDFPKACELCAVWDSERLERLAIVFLKCEEPFAQSGSRTIGQFAAMASWADARLREVESLTA